MKRIKVYGGFKSGKTRRLVDYLTSYIVNGKKCLFVSLGDFSEYDLYKTIKSFLPSEVDFNDVSDKVEYVVTHNNSDELIHTLRDRIDYDAIFIDPVNGFDDYYKNRVKIYNKLRDLSDSLDTDLYVSLCTPGSERIEITDF